MPACGRAYTGDAEVWRMQKVGDRKARHLVDCLQNAVASDVGWKDASVSILWRLCSSSPRESDLSVGESSA